MAFYVLIMNESSFIIRLVDYEIEKGREEEKNY